MSDIEEDWWGEIKCASEVNSDMEASQKAFERMKILIEKAKPASPSLRSVPVFGTCLRNVPHDIKNKELTIQLKKDFGEVFDHSDMICTKYTNPKGDDGQKQTTAIVSGARGTLNYLQRRSVARPLVFNHVPHVYVFLHDFGGKRDNYGRRVETVSGTAFHVIREREGPLRRSGIRMFSKEFRDSIPEAILNPTGKTDLFVNNSAFYINELPQDGSYHVQGGNVDVKRVNSASQLEAIQLIRKLNNLSMQGDVLVFQNKDGSVVSNCSDWKGLGVGGSMLQFNDFAHSIPLSWFDPRILDMDFLQSFSLKCFRCELPYVLVATSSNLEYLMARCGCPGRHFSYEEWHKVAIPVDSPYHHPGEVHTRLSYVNFGNRSRTLIAVPYLTKMSNVYGSAQFMSNVLFPILEEEWRATRDDSHSNKCGAIVFKTENLGKIDKSKVRLIFHIDVKKTKFWVLHKSVGFKNVTIYCNVKVSWKDKVFGTTVNADLRDAKNLETEELRLLYDVSWNKDYEMVGTFVRLTPNADKSEYDFCRKYLSQLPNNFNNQASTFLSRLFVNDHGYSKKIDIPKPNKVYPLCIENILKIMNTEQLQAFHESMATGINIIQGPPGTGKSFLTSAIALALSQTEDGVILCTAGSNVACDVMYRQIENLAKTFDIRIKLCRILSRGRELHMKPCHKDHAESLADSEFKGPMVTLHNLVAAHPRYLQGNPSQRKIAQMFANGEGYKMTQEQRMIFLNHVAEIERKILATQNILVMTVGCLSAYRLGKPGGEKQEDDDTNFMAYKHIHSILVDEAGILSMTSMLPLETLKPKNFIIIGDHFQLQPHVLSHAAEEAGLNRSMMELLVEKKEELGIKMTMIKEQFRAHSDLRDFTSDLTYAGTLRDAPPILTRVPVLKANFFEAFPHFNKSRIWVKNHKGRESKFGNSFANTSEADIVLQTVTNFLDSKLIHKCDIVVLTPYDGQKMMIQALFRKEGLGEIPCKTVDEYQGNEATCVIVSFTRSNPYKKVGFLMNANRVNVCISRAREIMVVCINLDMLAFSSESNGHIQRMSRFLNGGHKVTNIDVDPREIVRERN